MSKHSKFKFEKVQAHQRVHSLREDIRNCIRALGLLEYLSCIELTNPPDPTRLPYQSDGPNSREPIALSCVKARLSWILKLYWRQCQTEVDDTQAIKRYLDDLNSLIAARIDPGWRVTGDVRHGYWLEVRPK